MAPNGIDRVQIQAMGTRGSRWDGGREALCAGLVDITCADVLREPRLRMPVEKEGLNMSVRGGGGKSDDLARCRRRKRSYLSLASWKGVSTQSRWVYCARCVVRTDHRPPAPAQDRVLLLPGSIDRSRGVCRAARAATERRISSSGLELARNWAPQQQSSRAAEQGREEWFPSRNEEPWLTFAS